MAPRIPDDPVLCLACVTLPSCAGGHIADMPHWMAGCPEDAPPRPGSPEYDAWMAKRAEEAARRRRGSSSLSSRYPLLEGDQMRNAALAEYNRWTALA